MAKDPPYSTISNDIHCIQIIIVTMFGHLMNPNKYINCYPKET